jgi:hypothetical protein
VAIGTTYGAIAGAYYSYKTIPSEWISEIQTPKVLDDVVDGLEKLGKWYITQWNLEIGAPATVESRAQ